MEELLNQTDMLSRTRIQPDVPSLNEREGEYATAELSQPIYSKVVRAKNDPRLANQEVGLFSFTPSRNAKPDQYGIYGVAKLRGNYASPKEAAVAAELLIRNVDSINTILHVRVGETFPLTEEVKWTGRFDAVDLTKRVNDVELEKKRAVEEEEERERKTLMEREKKLLQENKEILNGTYQEDPIDKYIRLCVSRAQLKWSKADLERKMEEEIIPAIEKRNKEIAELDAEHPEFRETFLQRYMDARRDACLTNDIPEDAAQTQQGFLKYLVEDM